ncbi:MAG: acyltransferase [bacterium]|nr:acyltransferase [bacterium]
MSRAVNPPVTVSRDDSVETLRGIAIILLVAFHSVSSTARGDSPLEYVSYTFRFIRMPLFAAISGFVYAYRPVDRGSEVKFMLDKVRRLLLPFASIATLHYLMKALMPGINNPESLSEIWRIYLFGFEHYWFLYAIFLSFLSVTIIDSLGAIARIRNWLICLVAAMLLNLLLPQIKYLCFHGFIYLMPYFLMGLGLNRFSTRLSRNQVVIPIGILFVAGIALQQIAWFNKLGIDTDKGSVLALLVGLSGILIFFRFRFTSPWLTRLGISSYAIYLLHFLGLSVGARISWKIALLNNDAGYFTLQVLAGLSVPIVLEFIFKRSFITRRVFLGLRK